MKKRYRVTYVGDDSLNHREIVWAADHKEAVAKVKAATGTDIIAGVRKLTNPFVVWGIVILVVIAIAIEIAR